MRACILVFTVGVVTLACTSRRGAATVEPPATGDPPVEYVGRYLSRFEASWFRPCAAATGDSIWWVALTESALRDRDSLLLRDTLTVPRGSRPQEMFVRWRGHRSSLQSAGHLGGGTRYLTVVRILEARATRPTDCSLAADSSTSSRAGEVLLIVSSFTLQL